MTLPEHHLDDDVAAHRGDPFAEQRAMARTAAVVDRSHRGIITVSGPDRLGWLHLLLTQHVSALPEGGATEALVLDGQGRVLHHMGVVHLGDVVYLDVEAAELADLLAYLEKMVFWSKVEPRDVTAELALVSLVGPESQAVLAAAGVTLPEGAAPLEGGGYGRRTDGPGVADLVVPRSALGEWWDRLTAAGARPAGTVAFEALRVAAVLPRAGLDTDERTIPHEVGWIGAAVHLAKGCYRGQETVARVANMGRAPRRLVLLHLDAGDEQLPVPGEPVTLEGRAVGRVGTVVQHHELGPVALALLKRSVPVDAELTAGSDTPARIDPSSMPAEDVEAPGRAAQERLRGR
ncbi:MAG: folate-binding protein YgfZ [Pseudonocardia sp.]|nr:folate-binding protein YgfZ [Pseudonocardia sp.]